MESRKQLVTAILKFFLSEVNHSYIDEDGKEGLEVVTQVLESAYGLEGWSDNTTDEPSLLEIYEASSLRRSSSNQNKKQSTPQDKIKAEEMKTEGNNLMKNDKLGEAVECYSKAIDYDPTNAVYYGNRAAAYTKLNENIKAIGDCQTAVQMDPTYSKAYGRMGLVYLNDKNYEKAVKAYEKAAELEPSNTSYQNNLDLAKEKLSSPKSAAEGINSSGFGASSAGAAPGANPLANMDIGSLLSNPAVMNMAQSFMQNPQMQNMFSSMMGGAAGGGGGAGAPPPGAPQDASTPSHANSAAGMPPQGEVPQPNPFGGGGLDFANIMNATQQFAEQMRTTNPDLVNDLRSQFQQGGGDQPQNPPPSDQQNNEDTNR